VGGYNVTYHDLCRTICQYISHLQKPCSGIDYWNHDW